MLPSGSGGVHGVALREARPVEASGMIAHGLNANLAKRPPDGDELPFRASVLGHARRGSGSAGTRLGMGQVGGDPAPARRARAAAARAGLRGFGEVRRYLEKLASAAPSECTLPRSVKKTNPGGGLPDGARRCRAARSAAHRDRRIQREIAAPAGPARVMCAVKVGRQPPEATKACG